MYGHTNVTQLVLDHPEEDAKILVKGAFERTQGIKQYHEEGRQIMGKTGVSLGSYGESIYVDISESPDEDKTPIEVTAEKEVQMNVTANAEKYKRRFVDELDSLRDEPIEEVYEEIQQDVSAGSKEVENESDLSNGSSIVGVVMVITFLFFMIMMFAMMP